MNLRRNFIVYVIAIGLSLPLQALARNNTQTEPPKIIRKSSGVLEGTAIKRVEPAYPPLAKAARVTGSVVVEVTIDENGDVTSAQALSGHPLLRDSAVTAARGWKFSPTQLSGVLVKVIGTLTFNFSLPADKPDPDKSDSQAADDIEQAKQAVKANAYSPEAHFKLAEAYDDEDMYEEAVESYKRAIELKPAYKEAYLGLASAYKKQGKQDDEVETYRQAIAALPKDVALLEATARALNETERIAEAVDVQKRVVQIKTDDAGAFINLGWYLLRAHRYQDAISALQESIRIRPNNGLAYHNIGWAYMSMSRYEDAIEAYTQSLKAEPNYYQAYKIHRELGDALLRSRGPGEALDEFKRSIELNPRYAPTYADMGIAYHGMTQYEDAAESYKKAIGLQPRSAAHHHNLGEAYHHLGRLAEAEKEFREAIKLDSAAPQSYIGLATLLYPQNKPDEVDSLVRQAMQHFPKNQSGYVLLSSLLQHLGQHSEAEAALKKALQLDANNALALNNLGYIMIERNEKVEEALAMIQRAVKADPKNAAYLDSLGWAYFKLQKFEEAERYLTEAAQMGTSPVILDHLGDAFEKRGKIPQARDVWEKALKLRAGAELSARIRAKLNAAASK